MEVTVNPFDDTGLPINFVPVDENVWLNLLALLKMPV